MRIVITGAAGQVGRRLAADAAARGFEVCALSSAQWDITDPTAGVGLVASGDVVVNSAALTAVDAAEEDPDRARAVNADGPGNVAAVCRDARARLIHLSTDYVFGARTADTPYEIDDATDPVSVYGRTKLAGEHAVHRVLPDAHVVRTAWVYTGVGKDFVAAIRAAAGRDGHIDVVADQVGSPTYVADLVSALLELATGQLDAPIVHAANDGAISRYELARAVLSELGDDSERVRPVTSAEHPRPAPRPAYSALSGRKSAAAGLTPLRPWREALADALSPPR